MSELLIDVAWRGLEVGRQVRLHQVTDDAGRVDVALPMPVGSAVSLRWGALEIPATVTRVHEQSTSGGETAGMIVAPALDDASRAWWTERAAESAAGVPTTAVASPDDEPAVIVAPADPTARATMVFQAVKLSDVRAVPTTAPSIAAVAAMAPTFTPAAPAPVAAAPVPAPAPAPVPVAAPVPAPVPVPAPAAEAAPSAVTSALTDDDLRAARAAAIQDAAADLDAAATLAMPAAEAAPEEPENDTSRTTVMAAVDVEAIMAEGAAAAEASPDESGAVDSGPTSDTSGPMSASRHKGPRGKRRRGR